MLEKVQHKQVEELEEDTPSQLNITDDIEDDDENVEKPANQTISDMEVCNFANTYILVLGNMFHL